MLKTSFFILCCLAVLNVWSQEKRLKIIHADNTYVDEAKYPGATILSGNVEVSHQGIILKCTKAIQYKNRNILNAYGHVEINQGDSIIQHSKYATYNGNSKLAVSWGDVVLRDSRIELNTDTLNFDREKQILYYNDTGTIVDSTNLLKSKIGHYHLDTKKFVAEKNVSLTNAKYVLTSDHLEYFTDSKVAYLFGPSTVKSKDATLYSEHGFYNTNTDIAHFVKRAKIINKNNIIEGDSIYYNKGLGFSSATGHVVVTDTINHTILKGGYAENYNKKDSSIVVNRALAILISDKDSLFIHADTLLLQGKDKKRTVRAYHHVKFFKPNLQGKCDSIFSDNATGITTMFRNPVLWANGSQITGDTIQFTKNIVTDKLDSLKVLKNSLIVQKDSAGYNQIKGRDIYGKFIKDDLRYVDVVGNSEVLFYVRNDAHELIGINKSTCSLIKFRLKDGDIQLVRFINSPDGITYPESQLPENARLLRGFIWRENEQPLTKDDIFKN